MQNMLDQPPKPVWSPQDQVQRKLEAQPREPGQGQPEQTDDGYSRFYNSFGSLFNKLSAPLAFAGLPLIAEEPSASQPAPAPKTSPPKRTRQHLHSSHSATAEPDLSKIYSKAALRVVSRDGHGANDSFYVVPTSGHTMSYANILTLAEKEKRRMEASLHGSTADTIDDEDDFVDARETPAPLSPIAKRRIGKGRTEKDLNNAIEELCMENKSLKDMLDKLSKRLHAFEASAQNSSLALAESMRLMRPGSPLAAAGGRSSMEETLRKQNAELEERLGVAAKHIEVLEKDNQKMQKTLGKYREKWEQLKESAKARRGQPPANGGGGSGNATPN
jgi:prefoldin subunit 5